MQTIAAQAVNVSKHYDSGTASVTALDHVNVDFVQGQFTAIMGPSGSGKSTLMHTLAGLDSITEGHVFIGDTELTALQDTELTELRRDRVGFVFQAFNLVPTLTAEQNILLPLQLAGKSPENEWFQEIVRILALEDRLDHKPHELSGGQQQRVAIARALLAKPDVIFGDEPTGNLDSKVGTQVLQLLRRCSQHMGQTIIMVTHDPHAASFADRVVLLEDGKVAGELIQPSSDDVLIALGRLGA
ncbi:MAG: ABC transporter ATP-binding protein [Micrococcaceae bacterium]